MNKPEDSLISRNPASLVDLSIGDFDRLARDYTWQLPEQFNIAQAVCCRHADGSGRLALITETAAADAAGTPDDQGAASYYDFDLIDALSDRLARVLQMQGVQRGDRVAVILPQRLETALVHLAAHKLGAISLPLSVLFGEEALQYRLADSGARLVVTREATAVLLCEQHASLPALEHLLVVPDDRPVPIDAVVRADLLGRLPVRGGNVNSSATPAVVASDGSVPQLDFWQCVFRATRVDGCADTAADDPAFLLYTSGTTGPPKGALIPHRALIGNLPGFECSQNGFPQQGDRLFTPADWAWTGGLLDGLMPAWFYGVPVIGFDCGRFDAPRVVALMHRHRVTTGFFPPTALKMMRARCSSESLAALSLRAMMSAGEAVGEELFHWGRSVLGIDINEMCGQTEHNYLMGNCSAIMAVKPGSMGKAYPGHRVAIMDTDGALLAPGETGEIVAHRDDPVHFLGYWNRPEATAAKYTGDWFHTGDVGTIDADGYLWFLGRADDVISSAGYRIGPGEIEDCVMRHPAVLQVAAIGVPDPDGLRGDVVKLCIVLREAVDASTALEEAIRQQVRERLAAYEYPRIVEFMDALPMTTTGKVKRGELRAMHLSR